MAKQNDDQKVVEAGINFSNGSSAVVAWSPEVYRLAHGIEVPLDAPREQVKAAIAFVDSYHKQAYDNIDKLLGKRLKVAGVMLPYVDFALDPDKVYYDQESGNLVTTVERTRTVLKVTHINGREVEDGAMYVGFLSDVVAREFRKKYIPMFGGKIGDWDESGDFEFSQVGTKSGFRTYNVRYLG